jgi:hypothetical protein
MGRDDGSAGQLGRKDELVSVGGFGLFARLDDRHLGKMVDGDGHGEMDLRR